MFDAEKSAQKAIDTFTSQSVLANSSDDLIDLLETALRSFPVTGFGYWSFPRSCLNVETGELVLDEVPHTMTFRGPTYLKAFEKLYFSKKLYQNDQTLVASSMTTEPLSTHEIFNSQKRSIVGTPLYGFMRKLGICSDLYLPIHTPRRIQVLWVFSLSGQSGGYEAEVPFLQQLADRFAIAVAEFVKLSSANARTPDHLTTRELQCVLLLARGHSNKEIANDLGVSVHVVKFHLANLMQKLGATSRSEVIAKCAKAGWLTN